MLVVGPVSVIGPEVRWLIGELLIGDVWHLDFVAYKVDMLEEIEDFNYKAILFVEAEDLDYMLDSFEELMDLNSFIVFWLGFVNWTIYKVLFWYWLYCTSLMTFIFYIKFVWYNIFFFEKIIFENNWYKFLNNHLSNL